MESKDLHYKCNKCGRENKISKELFERKQTPFCRACFSLDVVCTDENGKVWKIQNEST